MPELNSSTLNEFIKPSFIIYCYCLSADFDIILNEYKDEKEQKKSQGTHTLFLSLMYCRFSRLDVSDQNIFAYNVSIGTSKKKLNLFFT